MWIDTHCHLDAHEFGAESLDVAARAAGQGVGMIVIPAVERGNFDVVKGLADGAPDDAGMGRDVELSELVDGTKNAVRSGVER